jgi:hypothetical protein
MGPRNLIKIGAASAGALVVAGAVVVVTAAATGLPVNLTAASPSPKPSSSPGNSVKQQYCQTFLNNFASALGKKPADVQGAATKAFGQTLDQAVKDGKLTKAQADQLKQKAASGTLCTGLGGLGADRPGPGPGDHAMGGLGGMYLNDAAKALGMSQSDLMTALRNGQTLQQIAASKGMDEQQFRTAFTAAVKGDLDAQVKNGKLTQGQEDSILGKLQTAPLPLWNSTMPKRPRPAPSATATTS